MIAAETGRTVPAVYRILTGPGVHVPPHRRPRLELPAHKHQEPLPVTGRQPLHPAIDQGPADARPGMTSFADRALGRGRRTADIYDLALVGTAPALPAPCGSAKTTNQERRDV